MNFIFDKKAVEIKHISHFNGIPNENISGFSPNDEAVLLYRLTNRNGYSLAVTNYGATVTSLKVPLENGKMTDIVLGFDSLESYIDSFNLESAPYLGATVGRFAGRVNNGNFSLNGENIQLHQNNGNHSLHGGNIGFSQKIWKVININECKNPSITLALLSPDKDENYPGALAIELTYTLTEENEFKVEYKATTSEDTIVNLTHHSYFNLDGHENNICNQELFINASKILEMTDENIPTGRFLHLANFPFDFTIPKKCPLKIDNTFVLDKKTELAASLYSKKNNLKMLVYTNQPAVHIYVGGNCFNRIKGKENVNYHTLSGICFETQNFPDAPNHAHFPSAILKKGEVYHHKTIYKFQPL
ncbi:aldose epimerase family protein [Flavobacterium sp. 3HN19-14]|uniref:aldose epimerase family protein n=1 Tax=Flavobacterium sp. 3HN19-14 TaxID=3448133 RepID=UPI003EDED119